MRQKKKDDNSLELTHPVKLIIECFIAFVISTFCIALFFSHLGENWLIPGIMMIALYLFVIVSIIIRLAKNLSVAALMLMTPIVPLVALLLIISLIPILQKIKF